MTEDGSQITKKGVHSKLLCHPLQPVSPAAMAKRSIYFQNYSSAFFIENRKIMPPEFYRVFMEA